MSGQIGSVPQFQPGVVQQKVQQQTTQPAKPDVKAPSAEVAQANQNQNFQKLAQDIIAKRADAPVESQPAQGRGQIVNLLV